MKRPQSSDTSPRDRSWAVAELLVAGALVVGANVVDVVPISETPWLVALGWLALRLRGCSWRGMAYRSYVLDRAAAVAQR